MEKFFDNGFLPFEVSVNQTIVFVSMAIFVFFLFVGSVWFVVSLFEKGHKRSYEDEEDLAEKGISITVEEDAAVVAAISAAITIILEEEARAKGNSYNGFKIVSFKRASKGRPWTHKN